jgi:hypothetical protein
MIFLFSIDGPNIIFQFNAIEYVVDSRYRRQHRVILVIVLVHPVSAYKKEGLAI